MSMTVNWGDSSPILQEKLFLKRVVEWAKAHQEALAVTGIIILLISIGLPYYIHSQTQSEKDASGALSLGQYYLRSDVDPVNGPFKNTAEKYQQCLQTFQRIVSDYPGTYSAKMAKYYVGKCQYFMGQYPEAYSSFDSSVLDLRGTPLAEEAGLGKMLSLIAQSQWSQAAQVGELFLKENPNSFLTPEVKLDLSDLYFKMKNNGKSNDELKEVNEKYPNSNWGKEAQMRLNTNS
jgi:tetratricopeptide (TPR) repeat protein